MRNNDLKESCESKVGRKVTNQVWPAHIYSALHIF
jgi:hypothetical protein